MNALIARALKAIGIASLLAMSSSVHARDTSCVSDAEFEAQVDADIREGRTSLDVKRFSGRELCSGRPMGERAQELWDAAFPAKREAQLSKQAWVMEESHRLHEIAERDRQIEDQRRRELDRLQYEAAAAQARRAAAIARAETADAGLRAARKEALLAQLPPGEPIEAAVLYGPTREFDTQVDETIQAVVEAHLREDAKSWWFDDYRPGSVWGAQVISRDYRTSSYVIFANFSYEDGRRSWVKIKYTAGQFDCIAFKNEPNNCRAVGDSLSSRFVVTSFQGLFASYFASKL
ncbi:hypothetical protein [Novosphingobium naphthalenivorans]|uniref:hypothetical protein n=1 Tax=Novosphingobium naphthalenivorans TaxID=273168 RepID=UPI000AEC020F|nr:hypothetical protein [Novosphingobium naphthalenivorans]